MLRSEIRDSVTLISGTTFDCAHGKQGLRYSVFGLAITGPRNRMPPMKSSKSEDSSPGRRAVDKTPVGRLAALLARVAANDFVRYRDTDPNTDAAGEVFTIRTDHDGELPPVANDIS